MVGTSWAVVADVDVVVVACHSCGFPFQQVCCPCPAGGEVSVLFPVYTGFAGLLVLLLARK